VHGTCRLALTITSGSKSTTYRVRSLPVERSAASRLYSLTKPDGVVYHIAETEHGPQCSCADWIYRRDGQDEGGCKHCKALAAVGLLQGRKGGVA
jgi:hypothetical protein